MNACLRSLAAIALIAPLVGLSQPRTPVIGLIAAGAGPISSNPGMAAVLDGLREQGFVDGRNVRIEARFSEGRLERMPQFARELTLIAAHLGAKLPVQRRENLLTNQNEGCGLDSRETGPQVLQSNPLHRQRW